MKVLVFKELGMYIAQSIEYDICTQAPTLKELHERILSLVQVELASGQYIPPAPKHFQALWEYT